MYLYIKAIHIFAVLLFITGRFSFSIAAMFATGRDDVLRNDVLAKLVRWDDLVIVPVLALVWISGYTIAFGGEWQDAHWLWLKLVFVAALTVFHLVESNAVRRALRTGARGAIHRRTAIAANATMLAAIVALVVLKPL